METKKQFSAPILCGDGGGAYVEVPFDVEKELGSKRPKVKVLFEESMEYQGTLVRMGTTCHLLIVRKDIREALNKQVGDSISVEVWLDTEPRVVEVPVGLKTLLEADKSAAAFFETLSYTCQKEYANYITQAKKEETRIRRANKAIELLQKKIKTPS